MHWRSAVASCIFFVLAVGCHAQAAVSSKSLSVANLTPPSHAGTPPAYRLAYLWLGYSESTAPAHEESKKDVEKTPRTFAEKVWAVLNSNFGLWVLSSVVLAWITKAYSAREAHKAEALKKAELAERLDTEIAYRLAMSLDGTRINQARLATSPTTPQGIYQVAYNYLENYYLQCPEKRDFSFYPEFRERTFRLLILELRTVVDARDRPDLKVALDAYEELSEGGDIGSQDPSTQSCLAAYEKVQELLQKRVVRKRWRPMVDFLVLRSDTGPTRSPG